MKFLLRLVFLYLPGLILALLLLISAVVWQQQLASRQDLVDLADIARQQGLQAAFDVIQVELYGSSGMATDPGYGRELVPGRGHAPWVVRSNLDSRPRVLNLALAPGIWAAYEVEYGSLYQVWQGEILFQGATYDYRHGPQPESTGAYFFRQQQATQWFLQEDPEGAVIPATVRYLGHEYGAERASVKLSYALQAGDLTAELTEQPELEWQGEDATLVRHFQLTNPDSEVLALFSERDGPLVEARGEVRLPLQDTSAITNQTYARKHVVSENDMHAGEQVIANSDCLGCHNENHQVVGPAWSRIAGRFRGNAQDESIDALTRSIVQGSSSKWGPVPMPPHPDLSTEQARSAALYILSRPTPEGESDVPLDANGQPYPSTRDYDINPRLQTTHPAFTLQNLLPQGFEPKVGGMDFRADGKLLVSSWDADGAVFLIDPEAALEQRVVRIAEGLQEPLGLTVVGQRLFVLQKQELTELIDHDGDDVIDEYRAFSYDWPTSSNFHSFAFGLVERDGFLYALLSICVLPGGASCPDQLPTQGKLLRISLLDGTAEIAASGFRTPNGIGLGTDGEIFVADNQGDWLPANKIVHIQDGKFYGSRAVPDEGVMTAQETAPVVWLPQDEIGNSPTQPLSLSEGPYAGQMIHGDIYNGGVKRVYMERINGALQGAVMQFGGGFQGGVNRLVRGPDGTIYVGEIGNPPNWGEYGKRWHGLERLKYQGKPAFELLQVNAETDGFSLTLTEPLEQSITLAPADLVARQWFYYPTEQYGGPKYDPTELTVTTLELSADRRSLRATIPGLKAGYVVYLRLDSRLLSEAGNSLWADEAWYTLNAIPGAGQETSQQASEATARPVEEAATGWTSLFDGKTLAGWRNYGGEDGEVENWVVSDGALELQPGRLGFLNMVRSYIFGGGSGDLIYSREKFRDFELSLEWKISENGNSGIFYFVADETQTTPWKTGLEMQVLHNEGHPDGQFHSHRAGDLYDMVAADPETVKPPGQWNEAIIRVHNNHIEHWLNGVKVVTIERGSERWQEVLANSKFADWVDFGNAEEGYIALQDHGDPVWFRNIRIRKLTR